MLIPQQIWSCCYFALLKLLTLLKLDVLLRDEGDVSYLNMFALYTCKESLDIKKCNQTISVLDIGFCLSLK